MMKVSGAHIDREARAMAACFGHEFNWFKLSRFDRARYHIEAEEIAEFVYNDRKCIRGCCDKVKN